MVKRYFSQHSQRADQPHEIHPHLHRPIERSLDLLHLAGGKRHARVHPQPHHFVARIGEPPHHLAARKHARQQPHRLEKIEPVRLLYQ
jgi:hypothetical protein